MASMSRQYQMLRVGVVGGVEHGSARRQRAAGRVTLDVAGELPGGALGRVLQVVRHEAAIDQHDAAVGEAQRRDDVKARAVFVVERIEMDLAVVEQAGPSTLTRVYSTSPPRRSPLLGERQRHRLRRACARRSSAISPSFHSSRAHLPVAERDQKRKAGERGNAGHSRRFSRIVRSMSAALGMPASSRLNHGRCGLPRPCCGTAAQSASP